ncbi:AvrD family protein [Propioniciclava flava]|uniref:AvrD family protein n=1 Tax=Propioniciclava flava TaxID=2072026 RepID=UPI0010128720
MTHRPTETFVPLAEVLGPERSRYFAQGYRSVAYRTEINRLEDKLSASVRCTLIADVRYPADWSLTTDGVERERHLSSVDAISLVAQGCESALGRLPRFPTGNSLGLRAVSLKSASRPWTKLNEVPIDLTLRQDEHGPSLMVDAVAGNIRVKAWLAEAPLGDTQSQNMERLRSVYEDGFRYIHSTAHIETYDPWRRLLTTVHEYNTGSRIPRVGGIDSER